MSSQKCMLIILDGWGLGAKYEADAIAKANTPFFDYLWTYFPHAALVTHGESVGLPDGQMGNSEVGHLNLGAGRVVYQELARINKAIKDGELQQHPTLLHAIRQAKANGKTIHLIGLVSDGGVHSHINHLKALCDILKQEEVESAAIHAFMDGRDTDPKGGLGYLTELESHIKDSPVKIASVVGRYFAMDRDKRWERVKKAYNLLVNGVCFEERSFNSALEGLHYNYQHNVTDEFIEPFNIVKDGEQPTVIKDGDTVICFNFRTDRPREITEVLTQSAKPDYGMTPLNLNYITMTRYDETYQNIEVLFDKDNLNNTIGEILAKAGKTQVRIAETEKYPHVTFFFSGGREEPFENERRILIPSPKVATYDLQPEMSARGITDAIVQDLKTNQPDFVCLNFANTDMVGHTGVFSGAMKAAETVDACLKDVLETAVALDYQAIILADHGNSDYMINETALRILPTPKIQCHFCW